MSHYPGTTVEIRIHAGDGDYAAKLETDGPSNGNVRLQLTHAYSGPPSSTSEVPPELLSQLGALLVTLFPRKP